jgi:hypothetical protein
MRFIPRREYLVTPCCPSSWYSANLMRKSEASELLCGGSDLGGTHERHQRATGRDNVIEGVPSVHKRRTQFYANVKSSGNIPR